MIGETVTCTYRNTLIPASRLRAVVDLLERARSESLGHDWHLHTQQYTVEYPPLVVNCEGLDEVGFDTAARVRLQRLLADAFADLLLKSAIPPPGE